MFSGSTFNIFFSLFLVSSKFLWACHLLLIVHTKICGAWTGKLKQQIITYVEVKDVQSNAENLANC